MMSQQPDSVESNNKQTNIPQSTSPRDVHGRTLGTLRRIGDAKGRIQCREDRKKVCVGGANTTAIISLLFCGGLMAPPED